MSPHSSRHSTRNASSSPPSSSLGPRPASAVAHRLVEQTDPSSSASREETPKADPRFYSERNKVPKIESLWDLYPDRSGSGLEGKQDVERMKKIREHSEVVTDPITGRDVSICDAKYAPPPEIPKTKADEFPPPSWASYMEEFRSLTIKYISFVIGCFVLLNGCLGFPYCFSIVISIGGGVTWWRKVESVWTDIIHQERTNRGQQRMTTAGISGNESVEWLNGFVSKLWPQVNADLFSSLIDLLEDVMQASIPSVVNQVKIVNMGQGSTPIRILSCRWLNEDIEEEKVPTGGGEGTVHDETEEIGEWASLEVAFAYRAKSSGADAKSKAKNANLLIDFRLGLKGVLGAPIPVWVELVGVTGICRLKVQLIPDPPFVKLVTISLMGMPKIEIAAVPLNQHFFNVMNLPVISDFINSSIRTAARGYVAPSNYTLDLSKILVGEDTKKELLAVGVLVVHIHSATGLKASDLNGKSDCYATLSYSKFAKLLWSSRIIFGELDPVWDETAVLMVNADDVKAKESLNVELWDSDRFTADDVLGRTELDIMELVRNRGKVFERKDKLHGLKKNHSMPGEVKWSVVYYGKAELDEARKTQGGDERLPDDLTKHPEFKPAKSKVDTVAESRVMYVPPNPALPSGIISVQIHNIISLERHSTTGSKSSSGSFSKPHMQTAEEEEEADNLPSAYCSIVLDSQKIYKTRTKPMTSKPFFNAGTERFVRDWRACSVLVVVRDSRLREIDPILGVVELNLSEVLANSSMISRFHPIRGGIGYGKIRISLLFRSIEAVLPKPLQGADIGSIQVVSRVIPNVDIVNDEVRTAGYVTFQTELIKKKAARHEDCGWAPIHNTHGSTGFRLGVRYRHSANLVLLFRRDRVVGRDKTLAAAVLWLKDIPDDEDVTITLKVYQPDDMDRFVLNCAPDRDGGKCVGTVTFTVRFHRGLGHSHRRAAAEEKDFQDVIDARTCIGHIRGEEPVLVPNPQPHPHHGRHHHHHSRPGSSDSSLVEDSSSSDQEDATAAAEAGGKGLGLKKKIAKKREEQKEMHRMERGVMQWKGARTLAWVGRSVKERGRGVKKSWKIDNGKRAGPGVESEV